MSLLRSTLVRVSARALSIRSTTQIRNKVATPAAITERAYSKKVQETDEEFDARWLSYFDREAIDAWELKKGINELYGHDIIPEPKIVVAMLKAARRLNDVAMAIRVLEAVKEKAAGNQTIYTYIMNGVKPTLDELGISTPEELGLA